MLGENVVAVSVEIFVFCYFNVYLEVSVEAVVLMVEGLVTFFVV